jgi:hypothetical protein
VADALERDPGRDWSDQIGEHTALFDDDPSATNTADRPDRVTRPGWPT